jgi:hypothetical protein
MRGHEPGPQVKRRADVFRYVDLEIERNTLKGHYELDERRFEETINFEGVGPLDQPAVRSLAELWQGPLEVSIWVQRHLVQRVAHYCARPFWTGSENSPTATTSRSRT